MGGIVVGVVVSMLIHRWLPMGAMAIALSLVVGMASCMLMRLNPQITTQVGVTALMVLVAQDTRHYANSSRCRPSEWLVQRPPVIPRSP